MKLIIKTLGATTFITVMFLYNDTQHNDLQHNDTRHNDVQHNDMQHDNTWHALNIIDLNDTLSIISPIMLHVHFKSIMLSLFMQSVVMLSVIVLNMIVLSVIMLSVVMLSVIMQSVVAPTEGQSAIFFQIDQFCCF